METVNLIKRKKWSKSTEIMWYIACFMGKIVCGVCVCVCVCVCIKYQENRITSLELLKQQILQTGLVFYLDLQFIFMTFRIFSTVNIFV